MRQQAADTESLRLTLRLHASMVQVSLGNVTLLRRRGERLEGQRKRFRVAGIVWFDWHPTYSRVAVVAPKG